MQLTTPPPKKNASTVWVDNNLSCAFSYTLPLPPYFSTPPPPSPSRSCPSSTFTLFLKAHLDRLSLSSSLFLSCSLSFALIFPLLRPLSLPLSLPFSFPLSFSHSHLAPSQNPLVLWHTQEQQVWHTQEQTSLAHSRTNKSSLVLLLLLLLFVIILLNLEIDGNIPAAARSTATYVLDKPHHPLYEHTPRE